MRKIRILPDGEGLIVRKERSLENLNEAEWQEVLTYIRWGKNIWCPSCNSSNIYFMKPPHFPYKCGKCEYKFNPFTGTILQGKHKDMSVFYDFILRYKEGEPSLRFARLGLATQKTAWIFKSKCERIGIDFKNDSLMLILKKIFVTYPLNR